MRLATSRVATSIAIALSVAAGCASDDAHSTAGGHGSSDPSSTVAPGAIGLDDATPVEGRAVSLVVHGMSCPKCVSNVDVTLSRIKGVSEVTINMRDGVVVAALDGSARPTRGAFARAVDDAGLTLVRLEVVP